MNYREKYLKYKNKYLQLKNKQLGGSQKTFSQIKKISISNEQINKIFYIKKDDEYIEVLLVKINTNVLLDNKIIFVFKRTDNKKFLPNAPQFYGINPKGVEHFIILCKIDGTILEPEKNMLYEQK